MNTTHATIELAMLDWLQFVAPEIEWTVEQSVRGPWFQVFATRDRRTLQFGVEARFMASLGLVYVQPVPLLRLALAAGGNAPMAEGYRLTGAGVSTLDAIARGASAELCAAIGAEQPLERGT